MTETSSSASGATVTPAGGAAILAPVTAFPNGIPSNALILIPLGQNGQPLEKEIVNGPVALKEEDVWKLLGFNGPAVQVQDDQGRPIAIGLEDLLSGLEKHWNEASDDLSRGRIYAQELIKYNRHAKAEAVLGKIVALGGDGEDWLALGITQLQQKKLDKAEATLRGAQNLLKDNPFPALHLARVAHEKPDLAAEKEHVLRAIQIDSSCVDAWAYLTNYYREQGGGTPEAETKAIAQVEELASTPVNAKAAAPYIALQGFYAGEDGTRDKAIGFAKKAVSRAPDDPLGLLCLSALYGQAGSLDEVVKLLAPHEAKMLKDVRIAHNYFEALFQMRDMPKVTALLNKLATSQVRDVKQFAIERSRAISQMLAQQQAALAASGGPGA